MIIGAPLRRSISEHCADYVDDAIGRHDLLLLELCRGDARHDPHFVFRPLIGPGAGDGDVLPAEGRNQLRSAQPAISREGILGKELFGPNVSMKQSEESLFVLEDVMEIFPRNLKAFERGLSGVDG